MDKYVYVLNEGSSDNTGTNHLESDISLFENPIFHTIKTYRNFPLG
jgi:hypothetical protein